MGKARDTARKWWREKEGFIALFCLVYWALLTTYILFQFISGQADQMLLDFYRSFIQLPLIPMGGIYGVKAVQDFRGKKNYDERV